MKKTYTYDYPLSANTVDMVIFTIRHGRLKVLLVERADPPFKGELALPGGHVEVGVGYRPRGDQGESLDEAADRELEEETGLQPSPERPVPETISGAIKELVDGMSAKILPQLTEAIAAAASERIEKTVQKIVPKMAEEAIQKGRRDHGPVRGQRRHSH